MRVIIAGTRIFKDFEKLSIHCDKILSNVETHIEIVCGGATGADELGKMYALKHFYPLKMFPANWDKHGKAAGPIRNEQMAIYADALICFWDGESRGSKNMIELAKEYKLKIRIITL